MGFSRFTFHAPLFTSKVLCPTILCHHIKWLFAKYLTGQLPLFWILIVASGTSLHAQTAFSNKLEGRVYSQEGDVAATHVLNMTQKRATITDANGFFSIPARLNDTLVFSAVQFKRKELVVSMEMLDSKLLLVPLEERVTELDEVTLMPYNLSGDINSDLGRLETEPVVTASTLGLPNAYVTPPSQAERLLMEATSGGAGIPLNPIINGITGRTRMLKDRVKRNNTYARTQRVRAFYADSLFTSDLKIPEDKIAEFMYFCEVDTAFQSTVDSHDRLRIWEFLQRKSTVYRENHGME